MFAIHMGLLILLPRSPEYWWEAVQKVLKKVSEYFGGAGKSLYFCTPENGKPGVAEKVFEKSSEKVWWG